MTKYYYAGAERIAVRSGTGSGTAGLVWIVGDHLGSTSFTVDATTLAKTERRYKPWGELRYTEGETGTKYGFTGQMAEVDKLYFYGSRFYDSYTGRWTQPDSLVSDLYDPLDWDRYQYVRSNAIKYIDPTGYSVDCGMAESQTCWNRVKKEKMFLEGDDLPDPNDIPKGINFPPKPPEFTGTQQEWESYIKEKTLQYYKDYRKWLIAHGYDDYVDWNGMITDLALVALVINSEFGDISDKQAVFDAALSALSNQYANNSYRNGPPICGGGCPSIVAQLVWLQAFEGMRRPKGYNIITSGKRDWTIFLDEANRVIAGPFGNYVSWGNGSSKTGRLCIRVTGGFFCVK